MPSEMLVLKGGTLIDGTGRPPIENSVIVIDGGRFKTIGQGSEISIPPDATVVDLSGKTVLPGFIDGHAHLEEFHVRTLSAPRHYDCRADRDLPGWPVELRTKGRH